MPSVPVHTRKNALVEQLRRSQVYRDYARAFREATGLPLALREREAFNLGLHGDPNENPFCSRMAGTNRTCANCLEMQRRMEAVRAIVEPAERLTIVRTDSMVIVTTGDGRTTRLSPDNSKIKDGAAGVERRSRWEGDRLVTDISGLGRGKATETYAIDPQSHQLVITFDMQGAAGDDARAGAPEGARGGRGGQPGVRVPRRRVYDPAQP